MKARSILLALGLVCGGFCLLFVAGRAQAEAPTDGGASIVVSVADGGDTTVEVTRGELKVRAAGQEMRVAKGQGAHVKRGERPKKISLLPPPGELKPADGSHLATADVALSWAQVPGANGYRLMLASDSRFVHAVHDARVDQSKKEMKLAAGTYYWRVSAVDREGLEGKVTSSRRFIIDLTPPKLKAGKPRWK
jgi:hypothetical protein